MRRNELTLAGLGALAVLTAGCASRMAPYFPPGGSYGPVAPQRSAARPASAARPTKSTSPPGVPGPDGPWDAMEPTVPLPSTPAAPEALSASLDVEPLVLRASEILDLIEAGRLDEAAMAVDALGASTDAKDAARALRDLLRQRLERVHVGSQLPLVQVQRAEHDVAIRKHAEAQAYLREGQPEKALRSLEEAYAVSSSAPAIRSDLVDLHKKLGIEAYGRGDSEKALGHWRRVLELMPDDKEVIRFVERANAVHRNL